MKKVWTMTAVMIWLGVGLVWGTMVAQAKTAKNYPKLKEFRIERGMPKEAVACIACHKKESPGIFSDWTRSRHANANITALW